MNARVARTAAWYEKRQKEGENSVDSQNNIVFPLPQPLQD